MKKRKIILLFACLVAVVIAALVWPREREPEYNGKKLSEWLVIYNDRSSVPGSPDKLMAIDAVRHIGTNALPSLLKWIQYDYPAWRSKLSAAGWKLPRPVRNSGPVLWLVTDRAAFRARTAVLGFDVLGPLAGAAIPELSRFMNDEKSFSKAANASRALSFLGAEAVPPLEAGLTSPHRQIRVLAAAALVGVGSNAAPTVPALVQSLSDQQLSVRFYAAFILGQLRREPGLVVPALTNCLQTTNFMLYDAVVLSLGNFGSQAVCAVPALRSALNDSNANVRFSASNALYRIAPEALPATNPEPALQNPKPEGPEKRQEN